MTAHIRLTDDDLNIARIAARDRGERAKRWRCREYQPIGDRPVRQIDLDYIGVVGEIALARWFDVPFVDDDALDRDTGDVLGLQVKTTTRGNGNLLINDQCAFGDYVLALAHALPVVIFPGWHTWNADEKNNRTPRILYPGGPPTYFVERNELWPMRILAEDRAEAR